MQDNIAGLVAAILIVLSVSSLIVHFIRLVEKILITLRETLVIFERLESTINFTLESDYKTIEQNAETALAEEDDDDSLYKTKDGTYSYEAYAINKLKQQKKKNPEDYIDDFEQAAEEQEGINRYGR